MMHMMHKQKESSQKLLICPKERGEGEEEEGREEEEERERERERESQHRSGNICEKSPAIDCKTKREGF
jgi:hypothetical protein